MTTHPKSQALEFTAELRHRLIIFGGSALLILIIAGIAAVSIFSQHEVAITNATVSAPLIALSPTAPGRLNAIYVNEGDSLPANAPVALVGTEVVKTKVAGLIVNVNDTIGAQVAAGESVVDMIDPSSLRVVGKIDENKGLARVSVGDPAVFTVDAFGGRKFNGIVDEISPTSNQTGIVFNISSQRAVQQFLVKARFDVSAFPYLKNGMSARLYVYPRP